MIPLHDNIKSKTKPIINWTIITTNAYVFWKEITLPSMHALNIFVTRWAVIPMELHRSFSLYWKTLITATFVHGGWAHIIGNMLFLYVFGHSVEDRMGHVRYLLFYVCVGMFANWIQAATVPASNIPLIGASGAIAGVLGAYFFYYPYARIMTLFPFLFFYRIVEWPAFIFLGFWFILQFWQGAQTLSLGVRTLQNTGGIAWWAHSAGFIAGLIASPALAIKRNKTR